MKKILIPAVVLLLLTGACKPSEKHYREAYESAVAKRDSANAELTIYTSNRANALHSSGITENGDTVPLITEFVAPTKDGGATRHSMKRYGVVVGRFKQVFNAREMRTRFIDNGHPGSYIVQTSEPLYYVISGGASTLDEAVDELRKVQADTFIVLRPPVPYILQAGQMAR